MTTLRHRDQTTSLNTIFEYISLKLVVFLMKLQQDSLYSWIQAISAFLFHAVFFGIAFSFGIFYVALLQEFPGQESEVGKLCFLILLLVFFWHCIMQIWEKFCFEDISIDIVPNMQLVYACAGLLLMKMADFEGWCYFRLKEDPTVFLLFQFLTYHMEAMDVGFTL